MNNAYFRITLSLFVTALIFSVAAYMATLKKKDIAPAFKLISHEYQAEAAIADQMRKLKDSLEKNNGKDEKAQPFPVEIETMEGYKIYFQPALKSGKWFYRLILTNPDEQRLLQVIATPETPDIFLFE